MGNSTAKFEMVGDYTQEEEATVKTAKNIMNIILNKNTAIRHINTIILNQPFEVQYVLLQELISNSTRKENKELKIRRICECISLLRNLGVEKKREAIM